MSLQLDVTFVITTAVVNSYDVVFFAILTVVFVIYELLFVF